MYSRICCYALLIGLTVKGHSYRTRSLTYPYNSFSLIDARFVDYLFIDSLIDYFEELLSA